MKITVEVTPSQLTDSIDINLDDLGLSEQEWEDMSHEEKTDALNTYVGNLSNQPYWMVDRFEAKE